MYTEGITKILNLDSTNKMYKDLNEIIKIAETTGHHTVSHNGKIWVRGKNEGDSDLGPIWVESPFTMSDFECK